MARRPREQRRDRRPGCRSRSGSRPDPSPHFERRGPSRTGLVTQLSPFTWARLHPSGLNGQTVLIGHSASRFSHYVDTTRPPDTTRVRHHCSAAIARHISTTRGSLGPQRCARVRQFNRPCSQVSADPGCSTFVRWRRGGHPGLGPDRHRQARSAIPNLAAQTARIGRSAFHLGCSAAVTARGAPSWADLGPQRLGANRNCTRSPPRSALPGDLVQLNRVSAPRLPQDRSPRRPPCGSCGV
jgi:hypothetical protein